jgi:hypothetical protein
MMLGMCNDFEPSEEAVSDLESAAPGVPWIVHSHGMGIAPRKRSVGYRLFVWGGAPRSPDVPDYYTKDTHYYGWRHPILLGHFCRNVLRVSYSLADYRVYPESRTVSSGRFGVRDESGRKGWCGVDGVGRIGADFWYVMKDKRGRPTATLAGYYLRWGGLDMQVYGVPYILGPGRDGPARTARLEMFRDAAQENEARVFLEKALTDPDRRARIGETLAVKAQELLDTRVRSIIDFGMAYKGVHDARGFECSGWQERTTQLYALTAEVAAKLR